MPQRQSPAERDSTRDALRAIYREAPEGDDLGAFSRSPRRRRKAALLLAVVAAVIAALLVFAGIVFSRKSKDFTQETVRLTLTTTERTVSGEESVWTASIANASSVGLRKAEVDVRYPSGFSLSSASPAPSNGYRNVWTIGDVDAGATITIRIVGRLLGDLGDTKTMTATFTYQPANFASTFRTEASAATLLADSVLDVTLASPASATSGQDVVYTLTARNTSTERVERVRLLLTYPAGFAKIVAKPSADEGDAQWDVGTLAPNATFVVTIRGALSGQASSQTELKAQIGVVDSDATFRLQRERSALILIVEPTLNVSVSINGSSGTVAAEAGESLKATVQYANDSDADVADVTITLRFPGTDSDGKAIAIVDTAAVKASAPFTQQRGGTSIAWTKSGIPELGRLIPGAAGSIDVTLPVKKNARTFGNGRNLSAQLVATVAAADVGTTGSGVERSTEPLTIRVTTELRLAAEARFYSDEGVQLGTGPLPPTVGATTQYHLAWYLTNTMNSAQDVLLTATLPDDIMFVAGNTTGGNAITYDAGTRQVRWRVDRLEPGVGQTLPTLEGSFTVSITPTAEDVGTTPTLLSATTLTGTDAFSGAALALSATPLTTELPDDTLAVGKGEVVATVSVPAAEAPAL